MTLTVCPCCGCKFEGDLYEGCTACGARAIGAPLAPPERELPFYGRAFFVSTLGAILLGTFLVSTALALFERVPFALDFWSFVGAAETAAWRLKWVGLPLAVAALWLSARMCAGIRRAPQRFAGARLAHGGLAALGLVVVMFVTFIGATVPERLRQQQRGLEAGQQARLWTFQRAQLEYRARYGTFPADVESLRKLPDADGSIAAAVNGLNSSNYKPSVDLAALPSKPKSRTLRGAALRRAAAGGNTDDAPTESISFTNYELRLPGDDKKLDTADDWIMRDGMVIKPVNAIDQKLPLQYWGDEEGAP
jgi:type II secretory pathway pseudopilin PulG